MKQDNRSNDEALAVVYFDATTRRKEKMRLASAQGSVPASGSAEEAVAVPNVSAPTRVPVPSAVAHAAVVAAPLTEPANSEPKSASNGADSVSSAAPSRAGSNGLTSESLSSFLINFVVEQTGYPPEIVEMDADLEADLGIDSIKVAQMFGELREQFGVRASDDVGLDDFPTLQHVMDYLLPS